jgi:hypothetical protein
VRFQVLKAASMMFRVVFWDILPCIMIIPDDGGSTHLWNVGQQSFYTAVYPRRQLWTSNITFFTGLTLNRKINKTGISYNNSEDVIQDPYNAKALWGKLAVLDPRLACQEAFTPLTTHVQWSACYIQAHFRFRHSFVVFLNLEINSVTI